MKYLIDRDEAAEIFLDASKGLLIGPEGDKIFRAIMELPILCILPDKKEG